VAGGVAQPRAVAQWGSHAAWASFMTPIGYQANLMVYDPGGYRFGDFLRFGAPVQVLLGVVAVLAIYTLHVR